MNILTVVDFINSIEWYWWTLILVVLVGLWVVLSKYRWFKEKVYALVLLAEAEIVGYKKGNERFKFVVNKIYDIVPLGLRFFFTQKRIIDIIEWAVGEMEKNIERDLLG